MLNIARFVSLNKRREIATEFSNKVGDILCSQLFQSNELVISKHTVTLSQACMLLWRDWFTGDVDGLWVNSPMLAAVYACVLLELIALGKISCKFQSWTGDGKIRIKILDKTLTNTYLDETAFAHLLRMETASNELTLDECVFYAMKWKLCSRKNCATSILNSLDELKILKTKCECFGFSKLYRTVKIEPYALLEKEIRLIVLKGKFPDCFMRILLTLLVVADSYVSKDTRVLKRFFTKNEYLPAVERLHTLVNIWSFDAKR